MTIAFKVSKEVQEKMIKFYKSKVVNIPEYTIFHAKDLDTAVTLYKSGKVVFQGKNVDLDTSIWIELEKKVSGSVVTNLDNKKKKDTTKKTYYKVTSVGSDEVGTGDFFGPIVTTASYVEKKDYDYLIKLGVKDSKKVDDTLIMKIAPILIEKFKHKTIFFTNKEYNEAWSEVNNMNSIKAKLHNKVLYDLLEEVDTDKVIIDQFVPPKNYFNYLKDEKNLVKNIMFVTKAESTNLSVAVSSVISRYYFLQQLELLGKLYNMEFIKGANEKVDYQGADFVKKFGIDELKNVSKLNFINVNKINELL